MAFFLTHEYEEAILEVQKTLELEKNYYPALYILGRTYEKMGQLGEAVTVFKKILALNDSPVFLAALGHAYALGR